MADSVTVSMGEEMRGVFNVIFLVNADVRSWEMEKRERERFFILFTTKEFVSVILQSSHQGADYTWQMHCTDVSSCFIGTSPQGHEVNEANLSRHFVSSKYGALCSFGDEINIRREQGCAMHGPSRT